MIDAEVIEVEPQDTAVVRGSVPMAELGAFFGRAFGEVFAAVQAQGGQIVGPPFGYYPSMPGETVEVEAGAPVAAPAAPTGDVVPSTLPGGRVVKAVHVGPYEEMERTYGELQAWMGEQGLTPKVGMWEVYLSDPATEPDPAIWRTEIYWPVET